MYMMCYNALPLYDSTLVPGMGLCIAMFVLYTIIDIT